MTDGNSRSTTRGLKPTNKGVDLRGQKKKPPDEPPAAGDALTANDLLDGGLDALPRTYYTAGFTDADGQITAEMKTLRAAQLAKAWSRLDVQPEMALDAIRALDAIVDAHFSGDLAAALPTAVKVAIVERAATHDGPEAVRDWLAGVATVFVRFADVAACCAHLMYVFKYMRLDLALRAAKSPITASRDDDLDVLHARYVLGEDPEYRIFKAALGEDEEDEA
jgi:hypothetical protein